MIVTVTTIVTLGYSFGLILTLIGFFRVFDETPKKGACQLALGISLLVLASIAVDAYIRSLS